ncbi:MAG: hypothetical protein IKV72_01405, partial [Firmicutes bacterium]|nr:hypothetical protein [Bacillota bacterium]
GVRTYQFTYHAEAYDTCTNYCDTLPWSPITYTFSYGNQVGYGAMHTTGIATAPSEDLICDTETFVNDEFRGDLQVIKSNETYDPFKYSGMGGARTT